MMVAQAPLAEALRTLIDARLDTIDRMLLGRVSRQDRLDIVREVELQVLDQLGDRDAATLGREDVLAVLARLDPPEAYLPEEGPAAQAAPRPAARASARPEARLTGPPTGRLVPRIGGLLGIGSVLAVALAIAAFWIEQELVSARNEEYWDAFCFLLLLVAICSGIVGVVLTGWARLRSPMAVAGLVTGTIGITSSLFVALGISYLLS